MKLQLSSETRIQTLQEQIDRLHDRCILTEATATKSEKLLDPDKFNGNCTKLDSFLEGIKLKLSSNADCYLTLKSQLQYACSRLEGSVIAHVQPCFKDG